MAGWLRAGEKEKDRVRDVGFKGIVLVQCNMPLKIRGIEDKKKEQEQEQQKRKG